jgi:hypothetical protein
MALGVAQAAAGMKQKALTTFVDLLTWRPSLHYDVGQFNVTYLPLFEKAQGIVKKKKRGSLELTSSPAGANAFIDGRFMGLTPTVVFGMTVGRHYATYKKTGYIKAAQKVIVSPQEQKQYSIELEQSSKYLLLQQSISRAQASLGQKKAPEAMMDLRSFLFIDQVIFAKLTPIDAKVIEIRLFLYDLRSQLLLNHLTYRLQASKLEEAQVLAEKLYHNVRTDGMLVAPSPPPRPPPPPPAPSPTPFYKTWWFWTALGAGVAAAIVVPNVVIGEKKGVGDGWYVVGVNN